MSSPRLALLAMVGALMVPRVTHAQLTCEHLAAPITDHSCFHARLGPFKRVTAGTSANPGIENLDEPHTHYAVMLPAGDRAGVIRYTPARSGRWAFYQQHDVPLEVRDAAGQRREVLHEDLVPGCPFFARVQVVELDAAVTYAVTIGPTPASEVGVVIEKLEDFEVVHGKDSDGDGFGDPMNVAVSPCLPAAGYVANDEDCDDQAPQIHPGAAELCGGPDLNCNGIAGDAGAPCQLGVGSCAARGSLRCATAGVAPTCDASPASAGPERCDGRDQDCDGIADGAEAGLCEGPEQPRCVSDGRGASFCGCERDADCGSPTSGRLCSLRGTDQRCVEGCVEGFGRNTCGAGSRCTSADPAAPGQCVPAPEDDDAGCGCRGGADGGAWLLALLVAIAVRRSRARRAPVR